MRRFGRAVLVALRKGLEPWPDGGSCDFDPWIIPYSRYKHFFQPFWFQPG